MTGTYCSTCGAQTTPGASFCATCGAALIAPPTTPSSSTASSPWTAPQQASDSEIEEQPIARPQHPPVTGQQPAQPREPSTMQVTAVPSTDSGSAAQRPPGQPAHPGQPHPSVPPPVAPYHGVRPQQSAPPVINQAPHPGQQVPQPPTGQAPAQPPQHWTPQTAQQPVVPGEPHSQYPPYAEQQSHGGQPPYAGQPYAGQPYAGQPYAGQPYAGQPYAGQPYAGQPYAGQPHQPVPAVPWGTAAPGGFQPAGAPRRNPLDALLNGDWGGALRTAGIAVAAMLGVSAVGVLMISQGGVGIREAIALVFGVVCLAVGGDAYAEADVESFGSSFSFGLLPLTVTLVGLWLLGRLYAGRLRARPPAGVTDALLQAVRTALLFTLLCLPLALLTRYEAQNTTIVAVAGRIGVGVVSTLFGALLFAVAALGLAWLFSRSTPLTGRAGAVRDKARAPLVGAVAVFGVGLLAVLVGLVYVLIEENDKLIQTGVFVIGAGNGALLSVLWSAGVPLGVEGSASAPLLGAFPPSGSQGINLFTFTDQSAWFWLAPVVLLAAMVLVATALAVRQNTIEDARKEGFRFAGALAVTAFAAALLLRVSAETETSGFSAAADGSLTFNPLLAAVVLALWGGLTGLLAPVVAAQVPVGFVMSVRRRFGSAEEPIPPQSSPVPPQGY